jgi:hypothetical protein
MTVTLAVVAGCAGLRQSAHSQLDSGGKDLSDKMLAYAMTIDLPEILVDSETVPLAPRASSLLQCARSGKGVSLSSAAPEPLGGCRGNVPSNLTIDPTRNSTTTTSGSILATFPAKRTGSATMASRDTQRSHASPASAPRPTRPRTSLRPRLQRPKTSPPLSGQTGHQP